ncbi:hypothetical protein A3F62_04340 [Candidatus Woesebacteria bacterium RIFCSPHIGHO2_12_FULL_44_11]|nr:MAG: hypothetical protein A3F62_04340 [Candidatus Woesebacteria bacterium RIFCSPHIGHO2_12_FULL_44_11]
MDEQDLKAIGGLLDKKLEPIKEDLLIVKGSVIKLENEIKAYMDALDVERKRIDQHDERLEVIEESLG